MLIARGLLTMAPCDLSAREIMGLCRSKGFDAHRTKGDAVRVCASPARDIWYRVSTVAECITLLAKLETEALRRASALIMAASRHPQS